MNGIVEDSMGATTRRSWKGRVLVLALVIVSATVIVRARGVGQARRGDAPDSAYQRTATPRPAEAWTE